MNRMDKDSTGLTIANMNMITIAIIVITVIGSV